jgi:hypothetical protein
MRFSGEPDRNNALAGASHRETPNGPESGAKDHEWAIPFAVLFDQANPNFGLI